MPKFAMNQNALSTLAALEAAIREAAESRKADGEKINSAKVTQYATLAAEIWSLPLSKGKLSRANREIVAAALAAEAGIDIDKGTGKRLYDGAVALSAQRKRLEMPTQATADVIEAEMRKRGMTSERAIRRELFPSGETDAVALVVKRFVGTPTYAKGEDGERVVNGWRTGGEFDRLAELRDALDEAERIARAVAENAAKADAERQAVADVLAAFDL